MDDQPIIIEIEDDSPVADPEAEAAQTGIGEPNGVPDRLAGALGQLLACFTNRGKVL